MDPTKAFNVKLTSEKEVTIDDVVNEANQMWKEVRRRNLRIDDYDATDTLMKDMFRVHPAFCKAYPVVNRYMCQMGQYNSKAFKMWLTKIKMHPWKTEEEYLEAQVDYIVKLFLAGKPRANKTEVNNLRANVRHFLSHEHNEFKKCADDSEKKVNDREEQLERKNASELIDSVAAIGIDGIKLVETYRVVNDPGTIAGVRADIDEVVKFLHSEEKMANADDLLL